MGIAIAAFVLLAVVTYLIVRPVLLPEPADAEAEGTGLHAEKERLLDAIRDLDFELATGKLAEEDHRVLRARYVGDAAGILQSIEESEQRASTAVEEAAPGLEEEIERAIAARKVALELGACPSCGGPAGEGDHFCRRCGAELAGAR